MTRPLHVLIADDWPDAAETLAFALTQASPSPPTTDVAFNGAEALRLARARPPTVAILDMDMPIVNGLEAATALRRDQPQLLPIAVTGNDEWLGKASAALVFDYLLTKPIDLELILELLAAKVRAIESNPQADTQSHCARRSRTPASVVRLHRIVFRRTKMAPRSRITGAFMLRSSFVKTAVAAATALLALSACAMPGETDRGPVASPPETIGPNPTIKPVDQHLIPTVQIAPAKGWSAGAIPKAAEGVAVNPFASGLNHPRWIYVLPNGDVLVAETNSPPKPDDARGIKGKVMKAVQAKAGAAAPTANRIILLRDTDGDGVAETKTVFIDHLNSPFGMALVGSTLYVSDTDAILKFPYKTGETAITTPGEKVTDLPAGTINHHWTKNIIASADGTKLYATTGSNSNAGENGIPAEAGRAAIYEVDLATGTKRLFATGLRNPNGMAWDAQTKTLWTVANERDELGNDLVPDYLTSVKDGAFYGWPYSYYGQHVDVRVKPPRPDMVAKAIQPDYALGAHVAALGLTAAGTTALPAPFANGMFIGEHGSWNRKPPVGYKVVFVPFVDGKPSGKPIDVLTGFVNSDGEAYGRPVGVAVDSKGALLVADDVGNTVWRAVGTSP